MSDRLAALVTGHSKSVVAVSVLLILLVGAGATGVEQSASLSQFETDGPETRALDYVAANFSGDGDTTTVQVIVRDDDGNVLSRSSLLRSLELQQALRADETVDATLVEERPVVGVGNAVAVAANRSERARRLAAATQRLRERNETLQQRRADLAADRADLRERRARLNATRETLALALNQTRRLQLRYEALNLSRDDGRTLRQIGDDIPEGAIPPERPDDETYRREARAIRDGLATVRERAVANLTSEETAALDRALARVRTLEAELFALRVARANGSIDAATFRERRVELRAELQNATRAGTRGVLADRVATLEADAASLEERGEQLAAELEDVAATAADLQQRRRALREPPSLSLAQQVAQLRSMNDSEVEAVVAEVVRGDGGGRNEVVRLLPTGYETGSTTATARTVVLTQRTDDGVRGPGGPSERVTDAQQRIEAIAGERAADGEEYVVLGFGLMSDEITRSQSDSLLLVGPLALVFVLVTLLVVYRDLLDVALGLVGIGAVLAVTVGAMGWLGIAFTQVLVVVPVLLIGLSVDYAIHAVMRHRERRGPEDSPREAMRTALAGVGVALLWVTATTVVGFASNLVSPLEPVREFGIVSSVGIASALLVFGAFVPALKVELDTLLERVGLDRHGRALGTDGAIRSVLSVGATLARRGPTVVIVVALLVTAIAGAGGSQVSTSFDQSDLLADEPPAWTAELPEPFRPGEYSTKRTLEYVKENFRREGAQSQVLVRGSVATPAALDRLDAVERRATESPVAFELATGETAVDGPLGEMRAVAAENETFNATFAATDTDGDGVPDREVRAVLDAFFVTAPDRASEVLHRVERDDGRAYVAARVVVSARGTAGTDAVTGATREWAAAVDGDGAGDGTDGEGGDLTAVATGSQVVDQDDLSSTVVDGLVVSIVAVVLFLMAAYRLTEGSATLGAVTLVPVALSVAWILGTMSLIGQPFNVLTGTVTSLTIGLGVAYSIHLSERYTLELRRQGDVHAAMHTAVTGTGGALLGSAATTVGGFGTLVVAVFPALQQFGLVTGVTIVYAFLASVLVLPSLLVVWTAHLGPDVDDIEPDGDASPGGRSSTGAGSGHDTGGSTTGDVSATSGSPGSTGAVEQTAPASTDTAGDTPAAGGAARSASEGDGSQDVSTGGTTPASDDRPELEPIWARDRATDGRAGDWTDDSLESTDTTAGDRQGGDETPDTGDGEDETGAETPDSADGGELFGGAAEPVPPADEQDGETDE